MKEDFKSQMKKVQASLFFTALLAGATLSANSKMTQPATEYYVLGLNWQRKGNPVEAEKAYQKAVSLSPNDADLRVNLANVLQKNAKLNEALNEFDSALRITPGNARIRILHGKALMQANKPKEAIEEFKMAYELEPKYPFTAYNLGQALQSTGQYEESLGYLQTALTEDPKNIGLLTLIATAQHKANRLSETIATYDQILELQPNNEWARLNLARALDQSGSFKEAETQYKQLLDRRPNGSDLWALLADIQYRQGNTSQAINSVNKALQIQPNDATLHAMLADYYDKSKNLKGAVTHYQKASLLEKDPTIKTKYSMAEAQVLFKSGQYDQSSLIIEQILAQNPDNPTLKTQLADIRLWQKRYSEAADLYREVVNTQPDLSKNKQILFNYAVALSGLKDWRNSEMVWLNYLSSESNNKDAWYNLGMAQENQKKYEEAINSYQKALALGTSKISTLEQIGPLQIQINDLSGAEKTYRDLVKLKPTNEKHKITLSRILAKEGMQEESIRILEEAGLSNGSASVQLEIAERTAKSGDYYAASTEYQKVLVKDPNNMDAIIGLADSYAAIGQASEAVSLYERFLEKNPGNFNAQYNYASALAIAGKENEAIREFKKAVEINPDYSEAYYSLGALLYDKNKNLARENWKKYLELQPDGQYKGEIVHRFPDLKAGN